MTNQPLDPNQTTLSETFSAPVPADITETEHKSPAYHATLADMVFAFLYFGIGYFFLDAFLGNSWNNFKFFFFSSSLHKFFIVIYYDNTNTSS